MDSLIIHDHLGLARNTLQDLMEVRETPCLTLYFRPFPVQAFGDEEKNRIRFKKFIAQLDSELESRSDGSFPLTRSYLGTLLDNEDFWKQSAKGMVWLARETAPPELRQIKLAFPVEDEIHFGEEFYLRPLMREWAWQRSFWVLQLDQANCRLYQADGHGIVEMPWPEDVPNSTESVPSALTDATLQAHSTRSGRVVHHNQADQNDEKDLAEKLFTQVGNGLDNFWQDNKDPIVLTGDKGVIAMYKNTEPTHADRIIGEVEGANRKKDDIHEEAWPMVQAHRADEIRGALERFSESPGGARLLKGPEEIVEAAARGKVETVYYRPGCSVPGSFDKDTLAAAKSSSADTDLVDLAVSLCIEHGGDVVALPKDFEAKIAEDAGMLAGLRYV